MPALSIIIPICNSEKTIKKCIDSIICQNNEDLEIIIVDDGSTDNSIDIIKKYQVLHSNIKYYYKSHTGVADTRNYGIKKANGDYIFFVDSDDYIDENLIKQLRGFMAKQYDVIKFKLIRVDQNRKVPRKGKRCCL